MPITHHAPANTDNTTGEFKGSISNRGHFVARELEYITDEKWFGITAIAQRYSNQSERRIELVLHRNIQPGTYSIQATPTDPIVRVVYSENRRIDFGHYHIPTATQGGTLELKISEDNNHYALKLDLTVQTHAGETLKLNIDGNVWLAIPRL